jgi:DNA-binding NtrC family response regulator
MTGSEEKWNSSHYPTRSHVNRRQFVITGLLSVPALTGSPWPPIRAVSTSVRIASRGAGHHKRRVVLIVDDEDSIRELIGTALADFGGWRAIEAPTSDQALMIARNWSVVLVISDIVRPDPMDGLEFLEVFKMRHPGIPVIIASGNSSPANRCRAILGGANGFLAKPFTVEELVAIVGAAQAVNASAGQGRSAPHFHHGQRDRH